jgi:hypothetical protein
MEQINIISPKIILDYINYLKIESYYLLPENWKMVKFGIIID